MHMGMSMSMRVCTRIRMAIDPSSDLTRVSQAAIE
eukprot:CAMPEP_0174723982 /NCGR_PEP_ID=MMETSP1094-20130205/42380_1 /TAXON_ID=156173 /ORGANISM="Chrysochromulina brevifilum, Strain UTEX LB 985" /LENGTH=34 /DNA_ID= /DNA_START= /DNA_END= /DNA_ORIENTATION=